jgi:IS30 family transposase
MTLPYIHLSLAERREIARMHAAEIPIRVIADRLQRQSLSKLSRKSVLATYVMDRLKAGWSPEQIAGRLRTSGAPERLSHETIYRFVYSSQGQQLGLYQDLPMARRRRRARSQRKPRGLFIPAGNTMCGYGTQLC